MVLSKNLNELLGQPGTIQQTRFLNPLAFKANYVCLSIAGTTVLPFAHSMQYTMQHKLRCYSWGHLGCWPAGMVHRDRLIPRRALSLGGGVSDTSWDPPFHRLCWTDHQNRSFYSRWVKRHPGSLCPFIFWTFWLCLLASGILVPRPGIKPAPSAVEAQSLNRRTAGEVPAILELLYSPLFYQHLFPWIYSPKVYSCFLSGL